MRVIATGRGEYGLKLRERGDVFTLVPLESPLVDGADPLTREPILKLDPITRQPLMLTITVEAQFAESWMERVGDETPERETSGQEALNREIELRLAGKA